MEELLGPSFKDEKLFFIILSNLFILAVRLEISVRVVEMNSPTWFSSRVMFSSTDRTLLWTRLDDPDTTQQYVCK